MEEEEFIVIEYPLPTAAREELVRLGVLACEARANSPRAQGQTKEGQALANFESILRSVLGVRFRRARFGIRGKT